MSLRESIKYIPNKPGVYFFKNKNDKIIYIGMAKILKYRVRSYFNKSCQITDKQHSNRNCNSKYCIKY